MTSQLTRRTILATAAAASVPAPTLSRPFVYWPQGEQWNGMDPAAAGFDPSRLTAAMQAAIADRSTSVLVLRNGRIVAEQYGQGGGPKVSREIASAGKSMVSVLTGMAIDDRKIRGVDQSAADFIPAWKGAPKEQIRLRHLLSMTSGLSDEGLAVRNVAGDQFALNSGAPQISPPGTQWHYNTPVYHLMFHVVARAVGEPFEAYAQRKLLGPLGMTGTTWLTSKGRDAAGREATSYYTALCTARDLARFGLFALRGGTWNGRRLISEKYFRASTSPSQSLNGSYGYLWWVNAKPGFPPAGAQSTPRLQFPGAPSDTFAALGAGGQDVLIVPSLDLVVVRQGAAPGGPGSAANQATLLANVLKAMEPSRFRAPA